MLEIGNGEVEQNIHQPGFRYFKRRFFHGLIGRKSLLIPPTEARQTQRTSVWDGVSFVKFESNPLDEVANIISSSYLVTFTILWRCGASNCNCPPMCMFWWCVASGSICYRERSVPIYNGPVYSDALIYDKHLRGNLVKEGLLFVFQSTWLGRTESGSDIAD